MKPVPRLAQFLVVLALASGACTGVRASDRSSAPRSASAAPPPSTAPAPQPSVSPIAPSRPAPFSVAPIGSELRSELVARNWHPGCPVAIDDLRVVTVRYVGFDGVVKSGPLVVNATVADDVLGVFRELFRARFPIKHVALPMKYHPTRPKDYERKRDVTAAFNCRPVTDGTSLSQHSYGWAIDVNPLQNPYVRSDGSVLRRAAKPYRDRSLDLPGMIHPGDVVVRAFARIGWSWGGDWTTIKDYMHFSLTGK